MRKLICAVVFSVAAIASVNGQNPTCDGRYPVKAKCEDGFVPPTYFESAKCEGEKKGSVGCKNAIAFNIDTFACSTDRKTEGDPPMYKSYCSDALFTAECTHLRMCKGVAMIKDGDDYTDCILDGKVTITTRLSKGYRECDPITSLPIE